MKPLSHTPATLRVALPLLILAFAGSTAWSQARSTPPIDPATPPTTPERRIPVENNRAIERPDEVLELSPFVVQTSDDVGYMAENTLAGSRLRTNIGDLAASITVVTKQQLLDTGALDMNDVFMYEANTEGTRNYTAFQFNDQGGVSDITATNPSGANRVRGIGPADRARNYYASISSLPFDSYNTDSVEISRGPNSLLFGLGSAAGIVNQSSAQANLRRDRTEASFRFGSWGSYRGSFNTNQAIVDGKLAIYAAGLYDSRGFTRKPSYDISRRGYAAVTYSPFRNTTVRANFERYNGDTRRPNTVTPQDGITEWRALGSPTWDPLTFTVKRNGVATVNGSSNFINVTGLQLAQVSLPSMYYDGNRGPVLWMQGGLTLGTVTGAYPTTLPLLSMSTTDIRKRQTQLPLFRTRGISDRSLYDWGSINTISGTLSRRNADIYNVEVDQRLLKDLYLQLGWYREEFTNYDHGYNAQSLMAIDTNERLVDGLANPFFLRPYFQYANGAYSRTPTTNDNFRANLAYQLDFTKNTGWTRWFGRHQFFALGSSRELISTNLRYNLVTLSNHSWVNPAVKFSGGPGVINQGAQTSPKIYVGGTNGNITQEPGSLVEGPLDIALRNATRNADGTYTWVNEPAHLDLALNRNTNRSYQKTDSITLGLQSSLWNERIIPTLGWRRDKNVAKATTALDIDAATGLLIDSGLNRYGTPQKISGNTTTAGVVFKPLRWISFAYNQSANFTPAAFRFDIEGKVLPLPEGDGKDYGVRFNLFDNKLSLGLNIFETQAIRARGTEADSFMFRVARVESAFITWATNDARARLGNGASTDAINQDVARITKLPLGYIPPALGTISSTSTVEAEGTEVQLIYNPVRHWNIKVTLGTQKSIFLNIAPEFNSYVPPRLPVWTTAVDRLDVPWWTTNNQPDLGNPSSFWLQNVDNPIKLAKSLEGKRTRNQRQWSGSAIMTYRFQNGDGWLRGLDVGGSTRFQDKAVIGYLAGAADADGVFRNLDPNKLVYDDPKPAIDLWVGKAFKLPRQIFGLNVRGKVQVNARNVFEKGNRLEPIAVNPDGTPTTYRITDPREMFVTTTFFF